VDLQIVRTQVSADAAENARQKSELPVMSFPQQEGRKAVAWRVEKGKPGEWSEQSVSGPQFLVSLVPITIGRLEGGDVSVQEAGFVAGMTFMTRALLVYQDRLKKIKETLLIIGREPDQQANRLWIGLALRVEDI
jgi:hypothetical protein